MEIFFSTWDIFFSIVEVTIGHFPVSARSASFLIIALDGFWQGVVNYEPDVWINNTKIWLLRNFILK